MSQRFHVHFVWPNGWSYDLWPSADSPAEAVLAADALLEYRERIGIRDYLEPDGLTVRDPAQLTVGVASDPPVRESALRCTSPDGVVTER
jgi:hypothetical protein